MPETVSEEQKVFEERLDKALDEAWSKLNQAVDQAAKRSTDFEMSIRLAAEAVEYSSVLFSLTYGLEDLDPEVRVKRNMDQLELVGGAVEALRSARELRRKSAAEAYTSLRIAADNLKTAYLDQVKKSTKKAS